MDPIIVENNTCFRWGFLHEEKQVLLMVKFQIVKRSTQKGIAIDFSNSDIPDIIDFPITISKTFSHKGRTVWKEKANFRVMVGDKIHKLFQIIEIDEAKDTIKMRFVNKPATFGGNYIAF